MTEASRSHPAFGVHQAEAPVSEALRQELEAEPRWMYPWEIEPGLTAPIHSVHLPAIHQTRLEMMAPAVREVLAGPGPKTAIDLACNEGWFSHRLLDWGATRVLGVDIRDVNIRRGRMLAERYGIGEDKLELRTADIFDLDPVELGKFDVVVLLGLIYHVEDPTGAIRLARSLTRRLCVIEGQLTRQRDPVEWGGGHEHTEREPASFAAHLEPDSDINPVASTSNVLSLIPNREAVEQMARVAGFDRVEMVEPGEGAQSYYTEGDRGLFLAWVSPEQEAPAEPSRRPRVWRKPAPPVPQANGHRPSGPLERFSLARRVRSARKVSPELRAELDAPPPWMYPWRLAPGLTAPIHAPALASVHETRREMIERHVRDALALAGPGARALDLACNEGWFSHRLLDWGAGSVLGLDIREVNIRRARLIAGEFRIDPERLEFRQADVFNLDPAELGEFDVVLMLGLIYHLENPVGAMRIARALTRSLCVVDTQLTRQAEPLDWSGQDRAESGSFAIQLEKDGASNPLASDPGLLSLIPNRAAVEEMGLAAGFESIEMLEPPPLADAQYAVRDRAVFVAHAPGEPT